MILFTLHIYSRESVKDPKQWATDIYKNYAISRCNHDENVNFQKRPGSQVMYKGSSWRLYNVRFYCASQYFHNMNQLMLVNFLRYIHIYMLNIPYECKLICFYKK